MVEIIYPRRPTSPLNDPLLSRCCRVEHRRTAPRAARTAHSVEPNSIDSAKYFIFARQFRENVYNWAQCALQLMTSSQLYILHLIEHKKEMLYFNEIALTYHILNT